MPHVGPHGWPRIFLIWNCLLFIALVYLLWRRQDEGTVVAGIQDPVGGVFPIIVPWAGALGGVTKSLMGAVKHSRDWDTRWNLWHIARPILGAITGSVAFALVVIVLKTTAGEDVEVQSTAGAIAIASAIAFLVGYKEQYFLDLVSKVAEVLLANGESAPDTAPTLAPATLDFGRVARGAQETRVVTLTVAPGAQLPPLVQGDLAVAGDVGFSAEPTAVGAALGTTTQEIVVTFAPAAPGTVRATLTVAVAGAAQTVTLRGTGQ